jgi:hypothetical protein
LGLLQNFRAKLEDLGEFPAHLVLEVFDFRLGHLFGRKVKDLFRQQFQDHHVVFAQ